MAPTRLRRAVRMTRIVAVLAVALLVWSAAARRLAGQRQVLAHVQGQVPDFTLTDEAGRTRIEAIKLKFNRVSLVIDACFAIQDGRRRKRVVEFLNLNFADRLSFPRNT